MKVSKKVKTSRYQRLGREKNKNTQIVDFETLWSVSFALENKATHVREIHMMQDDEEGRAKRLLRGE